MQKCMYSDGWDACLRSGSTFDTFYPCQIGAIVPWNYPFHNVFNPLVAALYAGNGIVIKVIVLLTKLAEAPALQGDCCSGVTAWIVAHTVIEAHDDM